VSFSSFVTITHQLYILTHCINIVFILQKKSHYFTDVYILN